MSFHAPTAPHTLLNGSQWMSWKHMKFRIKRVMRHVPSIYNRINKSKKAQPESSSNSQQSISIHTVSAPSPIDDVGDIADYARPNVSSTSGDIATTLLFQGSPRFDINSNNPQIDPARKEDPMSVIISAQALNLPSLDDPPAHNLHESLDYICNFGTLSSEVGQKSMLPAEPKESLSSLFITDYVEVSRLPITGGGFADIFMGTYRGMAVAVKAIRLFAFRGEAHEMHEGCCQAAFAWKHLRHRHLLPFLGVLNETSEHRICLISPWMSNGNIKQYLAKHGANPLHLLSQAASAIEYLHSMQVVHGDLKSANILIDNEGAACLADLGLSTLVASRALNTSRQFDGQGTTRWMAPELFSDKYLISHASDVYAFGMTIYEVLSGNIPFEGMGEFTVITTVIRGRRPARPNKPLFPVEDKTWQLIEKCWQETVSLRPSIKDAANMIRELATH